METSIMHKKIWWNAIMDFYGMNFCITFLNSRIYFAEELTKERMLEVVVVV